METTTQELIYQIMALFISGLLAIIGAYTKQLITTKIDIAKYGFENAKVEAIIDNGINYAEAMGNKYLKERASNTAIKMQGNEKLNIAMTYVNNRVDKATIVKYATNLDEAIERKLTKRIGS